MGFLVSQREIDALWLRMVRLATTKAQPLRNAPQMVGETSSCIRSNFAKLIEARHHTITIMDNLVSTSAADGGRVHNQGSHAKEIIATDAMQLDGLVVSIPKSLEAERSALLAIEGNENLRERQNVETAISGQECNPMTNGTLLGFFFLARGGGSLHIDLLNEPISKSLYCF